MARHRFTTPDDPLPLYVQDLTKTDYDRYSCELAEESSPLAGSRSAVQRMRTGEDDATARLNYEVTDVKFAPTVRRHVWTAS